ncbi:unnamed protein product [Cylindrotheca closterium]|uniref:Uncharacterized protein n=1 Tax=Cylindrotheca closterium TaxID=2856 RepID=A0AAD2FGN7_9STRA|nr:unnamed protein product [Cylindrotheca closterium]
MFDPAETNATEIFQLQRADDEESNRRLDAMKAMVPMKLFYNRVLDGWNSLDAEVQSTVPVNDKAAVLRAYAWFAISVATSIIAWQDPGSPPASPLVTSLTQAPRANL